MSGGAWEYVAGYVGNGGSYASSLVNAPARYKDTYSSYTAPTSGGHYGDAVWETSSSSSGSSSWYSSYSYFPRSSGPFFIRVAITTMVLMPVCSISTTTMAMPGATTVSALLCPYFNVTSNLVPFFTSTTTRLASYEIKYA